MSRQVVDVILPFPLRQMFTYSVPDFLQAETERGKRVVVQFGAKRFFTAIIANVREEQDDRQLKEILSVLDKKPVVNEMQFKFWGWISEYYMCTIGDVMKAALPSGLKLESETRISLSVTDEEITGITEAEFKILDVLKKDEELTLKDIEEKTGKKNVIPLIKSLYEKKTILIDEVIKGGFKPKTEAYVKFTSEAGNEEYIDNFLEKNKRAKRQKYLIYDYVELSGIFDKKEIVEVKKKDLLKKAEASSAILNSLVEKGIFEIYNKEISRLYEYENSSNILPELSESQNIALASIKNAFSENTPVLLYGVTSSGKTEIYFHLIEEVLKEGKQVLFLMPEIAITAQMINRVRNHFGNKAGVYHSKFSDNERVEIWNRMSSKDSYEVILGVRSSVFLPFCNLGLIIIDEEHESTYKQTDPAPRYSARDAAIMLARLHGAKVILGTATPSVETFYNANTGKYQLVNLTERYKGIPLPDMQVVNLKAAVKHKNMQSVFSSILLQNIKNCLSNNLQVIIFQNRRGFSPYVACSECGWIPYCRNCDVTLTYHKYQNQLVCHYCGYTRKVPVTCGNCNHDNIKTVGFGTEKVEEELAVFFPEARIARMDLDSMRSKNAHEEIIRDFEDGEIDILVGTQMITKGLDFANVGMVGILNADMLLNYPDFRSFEKSFQLMIQVSGRAGRKNNQGKVIIQTYAPEHPVIRKVINNDFQSLYREQISERNTFKYPPFFRLIKITIRHRKLVDCIETSNMLAEKIRNIPGIIVLGPEEPIIGKIQNWFLRNILIKVGRNAGISAIKKNINEIMRAVQAEKKSSIISVDVDPM
jgi:primosomal protein N' (replication factor Y)